MHDAIKVMLIAELRTSLGGLYGTRQHMVVGQQQPRPHQKPSAVGEAPIHRQLDPAYRVSGTAAPIQEVDRQQVALADNTFQTVRVTLLALDQPDANIHVQVGQGPRGAVAALFGRHRSPALLAGLGDGRAELRIFGFDVARQNRFEFVHGAYSLP